ncbi:MAG: DNA polymerase I [Bacteroidetes bacterium]|nr:MAG: DNA polymerase I [Bacteroidota bacterium]
MPRQKLFLLDAMALIYRAHFAFIKNPRITSKGLNTSALFGFTNTLLEIIGKENPTHLAVAFDTATPTFRHIQYPEYKAQREKQPEDISIAIPYIYKMLEAMNIKALVLDGFEADDLIGTISAQADPEQFDVFMVTPDKDYAQLVKENVFLFKPAYGGGGFEVLDAEKVKESYGVAPHQIADFLGLKGDAVDNIPGVPKIGDKTAIALLHEFGSLDELLANADKVSKPSIRQSLIEFAEQGRLSRQLAIIDTQVPYPWKPEDLQLRHVNLEAIMALMNELEFRTTTQRILNSRLNPVRPEPQQDLFGNITGESQATPMPPDPGGFATVQTTTHNYQLVRTAEERQALIQALKAAGAFCFDTETTDLDSMVAELVGISFSVKEHEAWFVHFTSDMQRDEVQAIVDEFKGLFADESLTKIGQNIKYDLQVLRNYGVEIAGPMFDTMLAHYVLTPESKHNMDDMARELLNYEPVSIETLIGKKGKGQRSMRDVDSETILEYAAEDADVTFRLKEKLAPQIRGNKIFEEIEQPLMPVLADMEYQGVRIDSEALAEYSHELEQRLVILEKDIYKLAGMEFNINSPKQLGEILFDRLKIGKGDKQKKTATGQYQTDEQTLSELAIYHELPGQLLAYRGIKKLKSTYVDALPQMVNADTGRVHTTFSQSVAVTGRLSSVNPNLQNIPIRSEDGKEVRRGFVPRNEDYVLLSADYSQVELRIMAAMSGDVAMCEAFRNGLDIHRATAARVFGVSPEEVTSTQRSAAKTVNFGIIYGISAFGLSQRMGLSRSESKDIIEAYFATYPRIKAYMDENIVKARELGYVETHFGRRRYLADINSRNATQRSFAERNAINSPIQGTAADVIKLAMIRIHKALKEASQRSFMTLQVHDELVFDVHREEVDMVRELVREHMLHAVQLDVPMEVEIGVGENWLEAH